MQMNGSNCDKVNWKEFEVPLKKEETSRLVDQIVSWQQSAGSITKNFKFKDFKQAIQFINAVAEIAEKENHHPQIILWKLSNVKLTLTTYCTNGLSKLDFYLDSKIDEIDFSYQSLNRSDSANIISPSGRVL
ncbi:MAG: 4a-hydroxytetrahydrobiopterin dehydratase [Candidatus Bathyarchaeia archaeon]